jgi:hypothetical protein
MAHALAPGWSVAVLALAEIGLLGDEMFCKTPRFEDKHQGMDEKQMMRHAEKAHDTIPKPATR